MKFEASPDGRTSLVKFPAHIAHDAELRGFYRELSSKLCDLQHPHIIGVQELLDDDYLVVEGLQEAKPLLDIPDDPEDFLRGLVGALEYAHWRGLPHRLLNCHCLWLFPGNTVKIWGFGLDYLEERHGPADLFDTSPTAPYWSPEHTRHEEPDARSDIWALGVVLYRWYSGRLPFQSNCLPVVIEHPKGSTHERSPGSRRSFSTPRRSWRHHATELCCTGLFQNGIGSRPAL